MQPMSFDASSALISLSSSEIMALFQQLHHEGETLLLVTHEREIATAAQRIVHMRDGQIRDEEYAS